MVIWNNSTVFNAEQLVKGQYSRMDHNFLKETHTHTHTKEKGLVWYDLVFVLKKP